MMTPLLALAKIIREQDLHSSVLQPDTLRAYLVKHCAGAKRRDLSLIALAYESRVPDELRYPSFPSERPDRIADLACRMMDDHGIAVDHARWAVATWAVALWMNPALGLGTTVEWFGQAEPRWPFVGRSRTALVVTFLLESSSRAAAFLRLTSVLSGMRRGDPIWLESVVGLATFSDTAAWSNPYASVIQLGNPDVTFRGGANLAQGLALLRSRLRWLGLRSGDWGSPVVIMTSSPVNVTEELALQAAHWRRMNAHTVCVNLDPDAPTEALRLVTDDVVSVKDRETGRSDEVGTWLANALVNPLRAYPETWIGDTWSGYLTDLPSCLEWVSRGPSTTRYE